MSIGEDVEPSSPRPGSRRLVLGLCLLLFAASFARFAPSLAFGYVYYDDVTVLRAHPELYDEHSLWRSLTAIFVGHFPREEPLLVRDLSWALDARLFGFASTFGYHFGNVVFYGLDVVLLFLFLRHATRNLRFAALTAGLFATLAIHVEPVCWIMGRKDVLGGFFTLLALLVQSMALRAKRTGRRRLLLLVVFLLYPVAVLAKFSGITLVVVLAAHRILAPYLDGSCSPRAGLDVKAALRAAAGYLPHAVVGAALYRWYGRILYDFQVIGGRGPSPLSAQHAKTLARMAPLSIGRTIEHVLAPADHSISYLRPNVALPLSAGDHAIAVAVVLGTALAIYAAARWRKDLLFFVAAFYAWLLPYANVEYIGIWVADRYAFLASACLVALLVQLGLAAIDRVGTRAKLAALGLGIATVCWAGYGIAMGLGHERAFRDARSLWSYENRLRDPSILSYVGLAKSFIVEAEATSDPTRRAECLRELRAVVRAGLARYRSLSWLPARGYFIAARTELSELYLLLGRALALEGGKPEQRVLYLRRAYEIYPIASAALLLAKELFDMALPADEKLARESLSFCAAYAVHTWPDPSKRAQVRALFGNYLQRFPGLTGEVEALLARLGS